MFLFIVKFMYNSCLKCMECMLRRLSKQDTRVHWTIAPPFLGLLAVHNYMKFSPWRFVPERNSGTGKGDVTLCKIAKYSKMAGKRCITMNSRNFSNS